MLFDMTHYFTGQGTSNSPILLLDDEDYVPVPAVPQAPVRKRKRASSPIPIPVIPTTPSVQPSSTSVAIPNESKKARKRRRKAEREARERPHPIVNAITSAAPVAVGVPRSDALERAMAQARANPKHPDNILVQHPTPNFPVPLWDPAMDLGFVNPTPAGALGDFSYTSVPQNQPLPQFTMSAPFDVGTQPETTSAIASTSRPPRSSTLASSTSTSSRQRAAPKPVHRLPRKPQIPVTRPIRTRSSTTSAHPVASPPASLPEPPPPPPAPSTEPPSVPTPPSHEKLKLPPPQKAIGHSPPQDPSSGLGTFLFTNSGVQVQGVKRGKLLAAKPSAPACNPACTLILEQLPKQRRHLGWVRTWAFKALGITEKQTKDSSALKWLAMDTKNGKGLVEFSTARFAREAWESDKIGQVLKTLPGNRLKGLPRDDLIKAFYFRVPNVVWGGSGEGVGEIEDGEVVDDMDVDALNVPNSTAANTPIPTLSQPSLNVSAQSPAHVPRHTIDDDIEMEDVEQSLVCIVGQSDATTLSSESMQSAVSSISPISKSSISSSAVETTDSEALSSVVVLAPRATPSLSLAVSSAMNRNKHPSPTPTSIPTAPKSMQGVPTGPKGMRNASVSPAPSFIVPHPPQQQPFASNSMAGSMGGEEEEEEKVQKAEKVKKLRDLEERIAREKAKMSMIASRQAKALAAAAAATAAATTATPSPPIEVVPNPAPVDEPVKNDVPVPLIPSTTTSDFDMAESFLSATFGELAASSSSSPSSSPTPTATTTTLPLKPTNLHSVEEDEKVVARLVPTRSFTMPKPLAMTRSFPVSSTGKEMSGGGGGGIYHLVERHQRLEKYIQETKELMEKVAVATSREEKNELMRLMREGKKAFEESELKKPKMSVQPERILNLSWPEHREEDWILHLSDNEDQ